MARKHTEEELAEFRVMIIDYMGKFYRNNGRLPKNSEISKSKCGFSYNTIPSGDLCKAAGRRNSCDGTGNRPIAVRTLHKTGR